MRVVLKAKRDSKKSWEKQTIWMLENGWEVTEEFSQHYGPFIKRLDKDGKVWLASNGKPENGLGAAHYNEVLKTTKYVDLPDFAKPWICKHGLVRPNFEREY